MSLLPEQLRALAYARKRGTEAPLDSIQAKVAGTYSALIALVEAVPADVARERRSTSGWSVQEVVDHLVESDRLAVDQLGRLLAGESVDSPIPASLQSPHPLERDWTALLHELRAVHQDILGLLAAATDDLPLTATAPVQMVVKCAGPDGALEPVSWLERFDWKAFSILLHAHNREHIAQVERILNAPPPGP
ncbi:MAG TPA: DinB family protein [Thermoanaerobaculia bacterium]|nr:DinB family protein [Thermoanaerobaculia bacterium]